MHVHARSRGSTWTAPGGDPPRVRTSGAPASDIHVATLRVSHPQDPEELEADSVAARVMRMTTPPVAAGPASSAPREPGIQRLAADRDPFEEDAEVDEDDESRGTAAIRALRPPSPAPGGPTVPAAALDRGPAGVPLDPGARAMMEPRFGRRFSRVRVHADSSAAQMANSLGALAFTRGHDIWFGAQQYQPATVEGQRVLAHELAHVVQQDAAEPASPVPDRSVVDTRTTTSGTVQRLGRPGPATRHNVYPWGKPGPVGSDHEVSTDGGSVVAAWIGYPVQPESMLYWCHGHSLGTAHTHGYSVYSGRSMATVVNDEWTNVPPDQTRSGDLAVWTARWDHSARFTRPVVTGGTLDPAQSELSTKNGQASLKTMSLAAIAGIYGEAGIGVFRRRS
jgi:hypothetical protein